MKWKAALKIIMLRYSVLALKRIKTCICTDCDSFKAVAVARECWHYALLYKNGCIEKSGGRIYDPRKVGQIGQARRPHL